MPHANRRTADGSDFRFRAGRPSLDLCSTLLWRNGDAPVELLAAADDVCRWCAEAGLRSVPSKVTRADLTATRELREAIYELAQDRLQDRDLRAGRLSTVNGAASAPDPVPRITPSSSVEFDARSDIASAFSEIARDAIWSLSGAHGRLKQCAAPDCAFLFLDVSPAGNRRWCAPDRCGNREGVRAFRRRQRAAPPRR